MNKCINCLHYEVCKYKDQEFCIGTKIEDLVHECKDYIDKKIIGDNND